MTRPGQEAAASARTATAGLHHVTALADDPQACIDFYVGVLGLHLVKRTVNFDDPGTYHLYCGDAAGSPGTLMTFFAAPAVGHGRRGTGLVSAVAFAVPPGSLGYWMDRFAAFGVEFEPLAQRFGDEVLAFTDPDGLSLELITAGGETAAEGGNQAIVGLHSVTMSVRDATPTAQMLTAALGLRSFGAEARRQRFVAGCGTFAAVVDLVADPIGVPGVIAAGSVQHVAFRAADDDEQERWRRILDAAGLRVSPVRDRSYFHSIYFREPGGILCEIATDTPGFAVDEKPEGLGRTLQLPAWLEPMRDRLEQRLRPLLPPAPTGA
jgi:glyoxalase family protein